MLRLEVKIIRLMKQISIFMELTDNKIPYEVFSNIIKKLIKIKIQMLVLF